jgi:hypothetical protein
MSEDFNLQKFQREFDAFGLRALNLEQMREMLENCDVPPDEEFEQ